MATTGGNLAAAPSACRSSSLQYLVCVLTDTSSTGFSPMLSRRCSSSLDVRKVAPGPLRERLYETSVTCSHRI